MKTILVIYLANGLAFSVRRLDRVWDDAVEVTRKAIKALGLIRGLGFCMPIIAGYFCLDTVLWPLMVLGRLSKKIENESNESTDKDEES